MASLWDVLTKTRAQRARDRTKKNRASASVPRAAAPAKESKPQGRVPTIQDAAIAIHARKRRMRSALN